MIEPISASDYSEAKAFIHDVVVILDEANNRFVQAEVIDAYTNMLGNWRYKLMVRSYAKSIGDNDIVAVLRR